ncbi:pentatricopeptide repeat-containing protein 2, mitochondrial-like [Oppia nitens]|uniref:pentatricopeptide repeat-containing protein 2, mitochondrial-like n=1 Tax=Oppia nitens TaxID=1686743 RepID=UPI0023DBFB25|nr:pentatricopeptide repeat-containing protein 2, mitochondrial-like [Oppia nitens]
MSSLILFSKQFLRPNHVINGSLKWMPSLTQSVINGIHKRYLFTNEVLGINGYLETRNRISQQFGQLREKFFTRMEEFATSESKMIFTEDLKNIVFMTDNNDQELRLLTDAIKKFHSQNQTLQFGTFVFGPIVMRLLHHLSEWQLALQLFKDPELRGFFSQIKSAVILMNLLLTNGKYDECMDVFDYIHNEITFEIRYPRDCLLLYVAAAYKLNTEEAYNRVLETLKKSREVGAPVSRKTVCLFAGLALNQNQPNTALEVLSLITQSNYITVKNLRLQALSDLDRFDDLFITLRVMLNRDMPSQTNRGELVEETFNRIKAKIESKNDEKLSLEWSQIERGLSEGQFITNTPLKDLLLSPVVLRENLTPNDRQQFERQRGYRNPTIQRNFRREQQQRPQPERRAFNEEF